MQSVSSRIWTYVAVSISYDDNHSTTGTIESIAVGIRRLNIFTSGISPKVNIITQLDFELAYVEVAVHRFSQYPTGITVTRFVAYPRPKIYDQDAYSWNVHRESLNTRNTYDSLFWF